MMDMRCSIYVDKILQPKLLINFGRTESQTVWNNANYYEVKRAQVNDIIYDLDYYSMMFMQDRNTNMSLWINKRINYE